MRKVKSLVVKIAAFVLVLALSLLFAGCDIIDIGLASSYRATMLVRSATGRSWSVSFGSLSGSLRETLRADKGADTDIIYSASLDEGELSVYYECAVSAGKAPLFTIRGGESLEGRGGYVGAGMSVKLSIETPDGVTARGGKLSVSLK